MLLGAQQEGCWQRRIDCVASFVFWIQRRRRAALFTVPEATSRLPSHIKRSRLLPLLCVCVRAVAQWRMGGRLAVAATAARPFIRMRQARVCCRALSLVQRRVAVCAPFR